MNKISIRDFWLKVEFHIQIHGHAVVMWSGGKSVNSFIYDKSTDVIKDWENVTFVFSDERLVPNSSDFSNAGNLLRNLKNNGLNANVLSIGDPEKYLNEVLQVLKRKNNKSILIALIGMGEDGHTLGMWKTHEDESIVHKRKNEDFYRFSFTPILLNRLCANKVMIINSEKKKKIFNDQNSLTKQLNISYYYD